MRVLLAYDDSNCANTALQLTASVGWPSGTSIEVLRVVEEHYDLIGAPDAGLISPPNWPPTADELADARLSVDRAATRLRSAGYAALGRVARGRPASVLARDARQIEADLIVVGSRGHGPMDALLLGSVSTELADHAPCPVLVTRRPSISRVLLATDGSPSADYAIGQLIEWGFLRGAIVRVVSVAPATGPLSSLAAAFEPRAPMIENDLGEHLRVAHLQLAETVARRLHGAGVSAEPEVRQGDAAHEIVQAARAFEADLVITGSRGLGTLPRVLLGSVARKVLLHADTSVMVMRPHGERIEERRRVTAPRAVTSSPAF
jgi:nucleotide-binding universal stress UspA family protein